MRLRLGLLLAAFGAASIAAAQADLSSCSVGKSGASMLLPAQVVCGGTVSQTEWSPSGNYLAAVRVEVSMTPSVAKSILSGNAPAATNIQPRIEVVVWSAATQKAKTLYTANQFQGEPVRVRWFASTDVMLLSATSPETHKPVHYLVNASSGNVKALPSAPEGVEPDVVLSPTANVGYEVASFPNPAGDGTLRVIRSFTPAGFVGKEISLPAKSYGPLFSADGTPLATKRTPVEGKPAKVEFLALDFAKGTITPTGSKPSWDRSPKGKADLPTAPSGPQDVKLLGATANAAVIWLAMSGSEPKDWAVVTTDGRNPVIAPNGETVSYESQGLLMVRPIIPISIEALTAMRNSALRAKLLSNAKQMGLAALMNSADNDDKVVGKDDNWQSILGPYIKDGNIMSGFVLTFAGGKATDVASPAEEMLGYFEGPGGRAVVYMDGHAKWINNKP